MTKTILVPIMLLITTATISGQQTILLNQTVYNMFLLNPSLAGSENRTTANTYYKKNWTGLPGSPELTCLTIDGNTGKLTGLGVAVSNEKAGIFNKLAVNFAFRYAAKLNKLNKLNFGLGIGAQKQTVDFSRIKADKPEEFGTWNTDAYGLLPDANFGISWSRNKMVIAASANQLISQKVNFNTDKSLTDLRYTPIQYFTFSAQNTFKFSKHFSVLLNGIIRSTNGLKFQPDVSVTFILLNKLQIAAGYRPDFAAYATTGLEMSKNITVRYSYEYSIGLNSRLNGGHEIGLTFNFPGSGNNEPKSTNDNPLLSELLERVDQYDQQIKVLNRNVDSLNRNLTEMRKEIDSILSHQVNPVIGDASESDAQSNFKPDNSLGSALNKYNNSVRYTVLNDSVLKQQNETETEPEIKNSKVEYRIVFGVYQLPDYARNYQKLVERSLTIRTKLIANPTHPKKYIYVCDNATYPTLKQALKELFITREALAALPSPITRGNAWILKISYE